MCIFRHPDAFHSMLSQNHQHQLQRRMVTVKIYYNNKKKNIDNNNNNV